MSTLISTTSFNAQFLQDKQKNWFNKRLIMQIYFKRNNKIWNVKINLNLKLNKSQNLKKICPKMMRILHKSTSKKLKRKKNKKEKKNSKLEYCNRMSNLILWTLHKSKSGQNELNSAKLSRFELKIENQGIS